MTMSNQPGPAVTQPVRHGRRTAAVRVLANALLVLLGYWTTSLVIGVAGAILTGRTFAPVTPVEAVLLMFVFLLLRWLYVLPGLLLVLVGIELAARRVPHARVLAFVVALAPMAFWELTQSAAFPSLDGVVLGVTAVLFAVTARLPSQGHGRPTDDDAAAPTPAEPLAASR